MSLVVCDVRQISSHMIVLRDISHITSRVRGCRTSLYNRIKVVQSRPYSSSIKVVWSRPHSRIKVLRSRPHSRIKVVRSRTQLYKDCWMVGSAQEAKHISIISYMLTLQVPLISLCTLDELTPSTSWFICTLHDHISLSGLRQRPVTDKAQRQGARALLF